MGITINKQKFLSSNLNGESSLPPFVHMQNGQNVAQSNLDEDDGLFVGYGFVANPFPYKMQDLYDRDSREKEYTAITLENEFLKAVFLPDFGGRLWSLFDKKANKELLYHNEAIRPCNLATRNAWLAGGIEFNCGIVGHGPFTCSRMFTAVTELDDGTPVLRMYEYERIRGAVYQMDFFLPEASPVLYGRMRIVNPKNEVVPMYWWTNIAVPEGKEYRNIFPAHEAYTNSKMMVVKVPVPNKDGIDVSYPTNNPVAIDHFWKIPENKRKYTAYLDKNGYGFFQTSTKRLKGRKLFVWGQGKGGSRWQEFLTKDGSQGRYVEIQAGLANTQYECLPMPPKTAWEWLECYGALDANSQKVHGNFDVAIDEVEAHLNSIVNEEALEKLLENTHNAATSPAERMICFGEGWGKLENIRRKASGENEICPYLDFGEVNEKQQPWLELLQNGRFLSDEINVMPKSWMYQKEWNVILEAAENSYTKFINLAAVAFADFDMEKSEKYCRMASEYADGPMVWFILSQIERIKGNLSKSAEFAIKVLEKFSNDISVVRYAFETFLNAEMNDIILSKYNSLSKDLRKDGRIKMLYSFALLRSGNVEEAERVLNENDGICVADIREGEVSITDLYLEIEEQKLIKKGLSFDRTKVTVPKKFDFRMGVL